jgi:hypothetical protein
MDQIDKAKPKKIHKETQNIWYKTWSYYFLVLIIFLVNFGF